VCKLFALLVTLAVIARFANLYFIILVPSELANRPTATPLSDHPQFALLALSVMFANTLESVCFVPSTILFLYHISTKLNLDGRRLFVSLFMDHQGLDYILLIGTKMYILVGGFFVLATGGQDNSTAPINYVVSWSHTYAIATFMCASFKTTQAILNSSENSHSLKIPNSTLGNTAKPSSRPPSETRSARRLSIS
jgi:hypothetical protein